jgi:DNA-binding transcriptional MerR regulator
MADEVQQLRTSLARMRSGQGRRYDARVRDRISRVAKQMREAGVSWHAVGEALGIPSETVRRICVERAPAAAGFVPVEIIPDLRRGELAVVTPGGHRVEGLDLETAVALLARLA